MELSIFQIICDEIFLATNSIGYFDNQAKTLNSFMQYALNEKCSNAKWLLLWDKTGMWVVSTSRNVYVCVIFETQRKRRYWVIFLISLTCSRCALFLLLFLFSSVKILKWNTQHNVKILNFQCTIDVLDGRQDGTFTGKSIRIVWCQ